MKGGREEVGMKKDRLSHFRKKLEEKHRQLVEGVGKTVLYGKGPEDDSIKDLGDQASSAYNREFLFELGNGDRRILKEVVTALQKLEEGGFGDCERCGEPIAEKRLEALPFARYCIDCQRAVEEEQRTAAG
jgi:DnaK suppressor protein